MTYHHKYWSLSLFFFCFTINIIFAGEREELLELRNYHSKTFLNPDGSYTTEISSGYLHFKDAAGRFQSIERKFIVSQHSQYDYELTSGLYEVFLEKPGRDAVSFTVKTKKGPSITCRLQGMILFNKKNGQLTRLGRVKSFRAEVEGPRINIENVLPGISLSYVYTDTKWKEEIRITQQGRRKLANLVGAAVTPGNLYIGFITQVEADSALEVYAAGQKISSSGPAALSGLSWNFQGEEVVDFRDRGGRKRFTFPRDFAVSEALQDSGAAASHAVTMIRRFYSTVEGNFMLSLVPLKWLRKQPAGTIIFDPQIEVSSTAHDTWIENNNYAHFGTSTILRIGRGANFGWKRSLLKFALSPTSLPDNARILSATCHLYWYYNWKTASGIYIDRPILLHQVLKEWHENEADWFERQNGIDWSGPGVEFNDVDARSASEDVQIWGASGFPSWKQYNLTALVNRWVKGNEPNYGIILWAANEDDFTNGDEKWIISSNYWDSSKHPRLVVNYTLDNLAEFYYSPQGTIDSAKYGQDVVSVAYDYTLRDWLENVYYRDGNGSSLFAVNFTHDYSGNILSQQYNSRAETDLINYGYDPVYQLKSAVSQVHDDHYFDYDPNGNILWKQVNSNQTDYEYDAANPNRLWQVSSCIFQYDQNGNITSDGDMSLYYDYKNQLMQVSGKAEEKYMYNSEGLRVKKSEGLVTSGLVEDKTAWTLEVTSAVNNVYPPAGKSMYRLKLETAPEFTNFSTGDQVVLADGLDIPVSSGSYLEYDIRSGQNSHMRASIQFYYYDPVAGSYGYSSHHTYADQNGISNYWATDLNPYYVNQWYHRVLPLASLQGKILKKVFFLADDSPDTEGGEVYTFYCDELKIDGQDVGRANGDAAAPTVFYEDFNDGNLHDGQPVDWNSSGSYWTISNGNLFWSNWNSGSYGMVAHPDLLFDDFEVKFDLKADGAYRPYYWAGISFRKAQPGDSYSTSGYMVYYRYNGEIALYGPGGNIASAPTGKELSYWRVVKITARDSIIKVYVDDKLFLEAVDNRYKSGYFSLNVLGCGARFDNLQIYSNPWQNEIYYIRDTEGNVIAEYDGAGNLLSEYVYGNSQRLAKLDPDGRIDYYLNDHLGSARVMAGSGWSANYSPFGEIASQTGSREDTHFDFTGQERDHGTGLIYFGARYYDPGIGRWMSVDPLTSDEPSFSPYHYTHNNPINRFDPDGKDDFNYFLMPGEKDLNFDKRWDRLSLGDQKLELFHFSGDAPRLLDPMANSMALAATVTSLNGAVPNKISVGFGIASTIVQGFSTYLKYKHLELKESYGISITESEKRNAKGDLISIPIGVIEPTAGLITDKIYENLDNKDKVKTELKIHRQDVINESITTSLLKNVAADIGLIPRTSH